ncbi:DUF423 domain-containing protein [Chelatococcus sambhunathii]|uniref:DUF423 domain-containing protein n=1 Tax=Chelatococcus sambhunathii TaxID=363953 RepID=A0ABU1DBR5_9HYPH|nr:DUF423 domain-containing protein [Chelatococcus sambhunathii]MDR4305553.1 DUF423 domain-containing protein [Chelatococcus sambhunathii]
MSRSAALLLFLAGLFGALGVATAAAAAHVANDPRLQTAALFLMLHGAALFGAVGTTRAFRLGPIMHWPMWIMAAGVVLFCGDLVVRVKAGASPLPVAAPIGGSLIILGWLGLAFGAALGGVDRTPRVRRKDAERETAP